MEDSSLATSNTVPGNQSWTPCGGLLTLMQLATSHEHILVVWPTLMYTLADERESQVSLQDLQEKQICIGSMFDFFWGGTQTILMENEGNCLPAPKKLS